jgi:hypothetical protein
MFNMKFKVEVECTPDEARQCLGLPNVAPLQDRILNQIETKIQENLRRWDPDTLMKAWLPMPVQGWGELQKLFWQHMGAKEATGKE